jgi:hypothetical protein
MTTVASLDSTVLLVKPSALAKLSEYPIGQDEFADADRSLRIWNEAVAHALRSFAMEEMSIRKLPVGDPKSVVEFFALDLRKEKKAVAKLAKLCSLIWLRAKQDVEFVREESEEDFFSTVLTDSIDAVVQAAELRRFLVNATNKTMMTKTKRTILLFHHVEVNAPDED